MTDTGQQQTILQMIETVDPADTRKLDEIDALVSCYVARDIYISHEPGNDRRVWFKQFKGAPEQSAYYRGYTRSRDALKAIRPEGWAFSTSAIAFVDHYKFLCSSQSHAPKFLQSATLPTEELAELHTIIQAIEHDRRLMPGGKE